MSMNVLFCRRRGFVARLSLDLWLSYFFIFHLMQSFIKEKSMENVFDPFQGAYNMFFDDNITTLSSTIWRCFPFLYFDGGRTTNKKNT